MNLAAATGGPETESSETRPPILPTTCLGTHDSAVKMILPFLVGRPARCAPLTSSHLRRYRCIPKTRPNLLKSQGANENRSAEMMRTS